MTSIGLLKDSGLLGNIVVKCPCTHYVDSLKCIWREIFINLSGRAFKVMKNGVRFIVIAFLVAELFKILINAN